MTTIDHRILIPAAPDVVWNYISDITHNPDWQVDCSDVIFLTSRREGPGVRWRYTAPSGRECVIAVSAWYNGLGYEYYFVDGMPFRENKGRIRLQEIPEGTIVQWTFTYELGGLFGGMRNTLGISREVDHTIADSLKTLWQKIKQSVGPSRVYEPKSLMRDAPDVEARSNYQPRHPSAAPTASGEISQPEAGGLFEPPISEDDGQPISVIASLTPPAIAEPPIEEGDTRPRIAVVSPVEPETVPPDLEGEPQFLEDLVDLSRFEPPRDPSDTQPKRAVEVPAEPSAEAPAEPLRVKAEETEPLTFTPPEFLPEYLTPAIEPERHDTPRLETAPDTSDPDFPLTGRLAERMVEAEPEPDFEPDVEPVIPALFQDEPTPLESATAPVIEIEQATVETLSPTPPSETETDTASIWDVFGVPRPSEAQQTEAVSAAPEAPETPEPEAAVVEPIARPNGHAGLRIVLRRKLARVRRF